MKIYVDVSRCESNAVCLAMAPEVFDLDDAGIVVLLSDEVGDDLRSRVTSASFRSRPSFGAINWAPPRLC